MPIIEPRINSGHDDAPPGINEARSEILPRFWHTHLLETPLVLVGLSPLSPIQLAVAVAIQVRVVSNGGGARRPGLGGDQDASQAHHQIEHPISKCPVHRSLHMIRALPWL